MSLEVNKIYQGDCLEVLKTLPENSIDSVVTDPPYELGFMGKSWDSTGIANNVEMWKECLRVLKPGGHLLAFSGTRTYHRMASAIEDAGFEVRDMIEWVYGSGFPKSRNIGKDVEKTNVGGLKNLKQIGTKKGIKCETGTKGYSYSKEYVAGVCMGGKQISGDIPVYEINNEWEGWGTALKPAHEPICMARKPLSDGGLDIVKTICYNITEKGLINNSNILWRIKLVKDAVKQKKSDYSDLIQQQKTVVVSAEVVETNKSVCVGKEIQRLLESMQENGEKVILSNQETKVQNITEQTKSEFHNTGKTTNESEKRKLLSHTEENVSVAESQDLSSSPLTTFGVAEDSIEKKSKMETSMSSLKSTDTQKTDIDCFAQTVTSQWVCMDIVRTIKVSFENKEYEFEQLSDGSLIWNDKLKPFREPKSLNVAENCLKWGTGGINIDESRVDNACPNCEGRGDINIGANVCWVCKGTGKIKKEWGSGHINFAQKHAERNEQAEQDSFNREAKENEGRFPANLIHNNSEEVRECFPESKGGAFPKTHGSSGFVSPEEKEKRVEMNDSGNASRFFKSIIYTAKASKSERNRGCEGLELKEKVFNGQSDKPSADMKDVEKRFTTLPKANNHPTVKPIALMEYLIKMITPKGGMVLDPFAGSGSTLVAAKQNGFNYIGIEMTEEYIPIIEARLKAVKKENTLF